MLVVKDAFPLEGIVAPVSLVGDASIRIVERALPMHLVVVPVSAVFSPLIVVKSSVPTSQAIDLASLVVALCEGFLNEDRVVELTLDGLRSHHWKVWDD